MFQATLDNGLKLIVQENHASRVASIQVWVRVGSADEQLAEAGLAHVHEHMLFKGTDTRPVGSIATEIESAGGDINAFTSFDQTVYHVTMASKEFDTGLEVLADAVQNSAFQADELAKELEVVLEEVSRGNDMPGRVAFQSLFKTAFTTHPYSRPVIGYVDSVKSFTRPMILEFYKRWYRPDNMCLVVVGDVDKDHVVERANALFKADASQVDLPERPRPPEPTQTEFRWVYGTKDIQETHLNIGWHGTSLRDADTPAMDILSIILGAGESSRLFRRVVRNEQTANVCYASSYTPQNPGMMLVGAQIHGDSVVQAYTAMMEEVFALRHNPVSDSELEKAKTIILSDEVYSKETVQGIARQLGYFELVGGDPEYATQYYERIRNVSAADVQALANKYLSSEKATVSVLAPESKDALLSEDQARQIAVEAEARAANKPSGIELGPEQVAKVVLENGITVLLREDRAVPLVSIRASATGGLLAETEASNGVTHLAAELIVRGTSKFSAEQISEEMDASASGLAGVGGRNSLGLRGDFLAENFARGFEYFRSCLFDSTFEAEELERERKVQLEDIVSQQDNMSAVAFENMARTLWSEHPYRMTALGSEDSVKGLSREDVVRTVRSQLHPESLVVAVVGAIDVGSTLEMFRSTLGTVRAEADVCPFVMPPNEAICEETRTIRCQREREQAHFVLGFPGLSMMDSRRWAMDILCTVMSGQGGRLFLELRDKQSLCYSVSAFSQEGLAPGYFGVYMGTAQEKLQTAEAGIRAELEKLVSGGISEEEMLRAKRYLTGTHEVALQRASSRCTSMSLSEAYGLGYDSYAKFTDRIQAVTLADVQDVAKDVIRFDRAVVSVVEASAAAPDVATE
jgi:zinc protease